MPKVMFCCIGESAQAPLVYKEDCPDPTCTSSGVGQPRACGQEAPAPGLTAGCSQPLQRPQGRVPPPAGGSAWLRGVSAAAPEEWDWNVPAPKEEAVDEGAQEGDRSWYTLAQLQHLRQSPASNPCRNDACLTI